MPCNALALAPANPGPSPLEASNRTRSIVCPWLQAEGSGDDDDEDLEDDGVEEEDDGAGDEEDEEDEEDLVAEDDGGWQMYPSMHHMQ
jgi:hypothetical protein